MASLNNESEKNIKRDEVKEIINDVMKDPQKVKAILEKNQEYQQILNNLIVGVKKRVIELEELKQKKLELLASL